MAHLTKGRSALYRPQTTILNAVSHAWALPGRSAPHTSVPSPASPRPRRNPTQGWLYPRHSSCIVTTLTHLHTRDTADSRGLGFRLNWGR